MIEFLLLALFIISMLIIGTSWLWKEGTKELQEKVGNNDELLAIQSLLAVLKNTENTAKAEIVYALMIYRDDRYTAGQIHAFVNPKKYLPMIQGYILEDLRKSIKQLSFFKHKNAFLPMIWWHTLNMYVTGENEELIQELWSHLSLGFNLCRDKYLQATRKKFSFDNSIFFQAPKVL